MKAKIERLFERFTEVEKLLSDSSTFLDQDLYKKLTQEHSYLSQVKESWQLYSEVSKQLSQNQDLFLTEKDPELIQIIKEEIADLESKKTSLERQLKTLLVPPDPRDDRNIILEIRAGTGGDEACLFVLDCVKMYMAYAHLRGWKCETISQAPSEIGGYREYIMALSGKEVFRYMQYEGGTHRVQRIPETETQGRLHTSAVTVAILLEPDEKESVNIDEKDIKTDTYRASGAGGQHVNVTDSAVRLTHIPTGIVVACQDERSQHKNKEKAMRVLAAKIAEESRKKEQKERSELRSKQVGTGDRSERVRTYNFPQNRVTDHRINLTLYKLDQIMQGDLDDITQALVSHYYQEKLSS